MFTSFKTYYWWALSAHVSLGKYCRPKPWALYSAWIHSLFLSRRRWYPCGVFRPVLCGCLVASSIENVWNFSLRKCVSHGLEKHSTVLPLSISSTAINRLVIVNIHKYQNQTNFPSLFFLLFFFLISSLGTTRTTNRSIPGLPYKNNECICILWKNKISVCPL